jgi:O-antigen/teichoic acid export membrane protein
MTGRARRLWDAVTHAAVAERRLLLNSGSMIGTAVVTALLGAAFWVVAARAFSQHAVGVASAAVSAMTLLGFLATVGLGTLLMGELPRRKERHRELIDAALVVSAGLGFAFGVAFALVAPYISSDLEPLRGSAWAVLAFAIGTGLTGAAFVLDQSLIGLLRGSLQLNRNIAFSVVKLAALFAIGTLAGLDGAAWIYTVWTAGIVFSLLVLVRFYKRDPTDPRTPNFGLLHSMRRSAATHHAFNLALRIPDLVLPIIVVTILSAEANAAFYVAWMIASLVFAVPLSLSTVLYAVGSGDRTALSSRFRLTMQASIAVGVAANVALLLLASPLLHLFGSAYADQATTTLHILALGAFPEAIRTHYVCTHRIERQIPAAIPIVWGGTILELVGGVVGAEVGGLNGVAIGWLIAVYIEGLVMTPDVLRAMRSPQGQPIDAGVPHTEGSESSQAEGV